MAIVFLVVAIGSKLHQSYGQPPHVYVIDSVTSIVKQH